jgi:transcriptional regulator with XRE-family HTH domain
MALQPDRLKQRRRTLHLSQEQLAELAGVNQPQISRWELGENDITGATLSVLAQALGTTSDWLLGLSDSPFQLEPTDTTLDSLEYELVTAVRAVKPTHRHILLVLARELADLD